jgi:hypothetical protein
MLIRLLLLSACCLLLPEQAFAWGGGTHLTIGLEVLQRLQQLPPNLATLLANASDDFLYGCMAADIIVGKKYTHYLLNCHRWRVGSRLLQAATTDPQRACAWGYLCHLAADVVAHNYFVPYKTIRSFATIAMRHTYWEMRYEAFVEPATWVRARTVCQNGRGLDDSLLRRVMAPTLFSFGNSKRIFNSILLLSRLERWQLLMRTLSQRSDHLLSEEDHQEYFAVTMETVMDLLRHGDDSFCWLADPTGETALAAAQELRRHLRFLYKAGHVSKAGGVERAEFLKPTLRRAMHQPELLEILRTACHEPSSPFVMPPSA